MTEENGRHLAVLHSSKARSIGSRIGIDLDRYHDLTIAICLTTAASLCPKVRRAIAHIEHNYHRRLTLESVGAAVGYHPNHLCRKFREELSLSFHEYLVRVRLKKAVGLLVYTDDPIKAVAYRVGFGRPERLSRAFARWIRCSPRVFRDRYRYQ